MSSKGQIDIRHAEVDFDQLPQPVVCFGRNLTAGEVLSFHQHQRTQLVYASSGVMKVKTRESEYLIPPQRAVWMPGGVEHQIEARHAVEMRTLYIEARLAAELKSDVCVLQVSPLLRELIIEAVAYSHPVTADDRQERLLAVIIDQIEKQALAPALSLPMPSDPRLTKITRVLIDDPSHPAELADWSRQVGASVRTLVRLFPAQTGMTFREWRQQRRLLRALELLASGETVTAVSHELGYDSSSAFIAMFKRNLGTTPARYFS